MALRLFSLLAACTLSACSLAQHPPASGDPARDAMSKLSFLVGRWRGEGRFMTGPGKWQSAVVVEEVQSKLAGLLFVVEGLGVDKESPDKVVHQAFAVLSYDPVAKKYTMRPYLATGQSVEARVALQDNKVQWSMDVPQVGEIRYSVWLNEKGQWEEVGEMTRDQGKTWLKFFEMKLDKQKD